MLCKVCGGESEHVFQGQILKKYTVDYWRCPACEFMQTEEPYWLEEAYASAISDLDLGPVNRALTGAQITEGVIVSRFDPNAKFIDWGGGYGVFTRHMRDMGYDFHWRDLYCENLFAKQFVADMQTRYELLTAFEVFEHLVQPIAEIETMLTCASNLLFTTELPQTRLTSAAQWWYLTPEHGQHVSIYSPRSLQVIADRFGLHLASDGKSIHLLSRQPFPNRLFRIIARNGRAARMVRRIGRRRLRTHSLLIRDFRAVTGWDV